MNRIKTDALLRHTSLRQLQMLEAVAQLGGYTRAAEALNLTQPTVWMQINKLSDSVGLALFEKIDKQLHLTVAGRAMLDAAQDVLDRLRQLDNDIIAIKGEIKGELRMAVVTSAKYFMPHILGAFVQRYPEVEPCLTVTNRKKVLQRLRANDDDLFIMGKVPDDLEVEATAFLDNELVVLAPPTHALAQQPLISLETLLAEHFLEREPGSGTRIAVDQLFSEKGLHLKPYMELGSSEAIKQAVIGGLGLSVLSRHNLRLELAGKHLVVLDVQGFPLRRDWYAVHLKKKRLTLVAQTFLDFILTESDRILNESFNNLLIK